MNVHEVIAEARRLGIELWANGEQLRYRARGGLPPQLRAALTVHKTELLALLRDSCERARAIARHCEAAGTDVAAYLAEHAPDLLNESERPCSPAESIVATCRRYGVELRIDPASGDLVVGRAGARADEPSRPWPSLMRAIEAHLQEIARLVDAGWTLIAAFPMDQIAA